MARIQPIHFFCQPVQLGVSRPTLRKAIKRLVQGGVVQVLPGSSGGLMRGWVPQAEQARAAALQVVLIGCLIALMLVLRPRGIWGETLQRPGATR